MTQYNFTLPYLSPNQSQYYNTALSSLPSVLSEDPQIQTFVCLMAVVLGNTQDSIDSFTSLVDIDSCPDAFVPYLSAVVGYPYNYSLTASSQRALIKSYLPLYMLRGSVLSIKMAVRFGGTTAYNTSDPALNDVLISPDTSGSATVGGTTYTGNGLYYITIPSSINTSNQSVYLTNPAGYLPIITRLLETTTIVAPFDASALEVNALYSYPLAYLVENNYTLQGVDTQSLGIAFSSYVTATRPSGETVLVCGTSAVSQGVAIEGEY